MTVRFFCLFALFLITTSNVYAEEPSAATETVRKLKNAFSSDWKAIEFGLWHDGGDYLSFGPYCTVSRLPDDRYLLSFRNQSNRESGSIAVPLRYMSEDQMKGALAQVLAVAKAASQQISEYERFSKLPKEERDAIRKKLSFGMSSTFMTITIAGERQRRFSLSFDEIEPTVGDYANFIEKLRKEKQE